MRVIICGAGQVGYGIAEGLAAQQHDVTVVDYEPRLIENIRNTLDVRGLVGHGAQPDVLAAAGAAEADMLIAVTLYDEVNMIACQVAHSLFNVPTKIARVRDQSYLDPRYQKLFSRENLPIDVVISPEIEVGKMILRRIVLPGALDVLYFSDDLVAALVVECGDSCLLLDTPLRQLHDLFPDLQATVVAVRRNNKFFIARSETKLLAGDIAYLVTAKEQVRRTLSLFGHEEQEANRIVIAGGGQIGLYVAHAIEKRHHRAKVKIIEADQKRAYMISDQLKQTIVLHGSALDAAVLEEANIDKADLLVALTNQDQVNILSAIMAKRLGCKSNMALINNLAYQQFNRAVGIDATLNPRSVTASKILQQTRRGRIRAVHTVADGEAEIIEAEAMETSPLVGQPISELELPTGLRIGIIVRKGELITPVAATQVKAGDRIIIFAMAENVKDVEQLFRVSFDYF